MTVERGERRRWESERRYYGALLHQDLLGDWVVDVQWGGKYNRLGGRETHAVGSYGEGQAVLLAIHRERLARRYACVE
jgi:hypothetical protein